MTYSFGSDFTWGAASSGPQHEGGASEGGREPSIWDAYYEKAPHRFFNGVGPSVCGDFYNRYKEDISIMKDLGLQSYRTSIQWSRLLPYGAQTPAPDAVRFYNDVIDTLLSNGITPYINLHHFDLPWSIQEQGGWENRDTIEKFNFFAKICFKLFGDRVRHWFTFNEPIVVPYIAYLGGDALYPNVIDMHRGMTVAYHTAIAHAEATRTFRQEGYEGKIGIILNIAPSYPRSEHPEDVKAARLADLFHNESFKDPALKGVYSQELIKFMADNKMPLPIIKGDDALIAQGKVDIMGINYYAPQRVKVKESLPNPKAPISPSTFFDLYEMPGRKMNPYRGWEIYPQGIYDTLIDIRDNYNNIETFISENGMGVENEERFRNTEGYIEDNYRIEFIKDHLSLVNKAISEGCACKGYHLWTFVDNWSWQNAYKNRYGYVELNLGQNNKRIIKKSGHWLKETIKNRSFEY
ncbi:MAG: glycoside hydrolase family 1 protein [Brevinema sp.]